LFEYHHHQHHHHHHHHPRIRPLGLFLFQNLFSETYESIWAISKTPRTGDEPHARPQTARPLGAAYLFVYIV
jgi:hypothetical protein